MPGRWLATLARNVWQYRSLNEAKKVRVRQCTQVMVAEKSWEGVDGFKVNDEVKVTIAATASLLTLGLKRAFYFDRVETIIVYPGPIRNRKMQRGMIVTEDDGYFSGLAWQGGPLVFSWPHVLRGSQQPGDGQNVIIHEFVHHIDGMDGEMGGIPIIESNELRARWSSVLNRRYRELSEEIQQGRRTFIGEYAATNLAEFFAVASESFFDSPGILKTNWPDVYEILREFFDINPIEFEN